MKKIFSLLIVLILVVGITGCGKGKEETNNESEPTTPATILAKEFESIIKDEKNISVVAQKLSENEVIKSKMVVEEKTPEDFLNGFDDKITKFKKASSFQPMIGSIPFVAYVFETDDAVSLESELKEKANPNWNICVTADETVVKVVDNYVFFVMSPKEFED